jgi:hypothetical protein
MCFHFKCALTFAPFYIAVILHIMLAHYEPSEVINLLILFSVLKCIIAQNYYE